MRQEQTNVPDSGGMCAHTVQDVLNTLLTAEKLMMTFYYAGLTSPAVMRNRALGGQSADPNNPGLPPGGHPSNVRSLQAALDAEEKHAAALLSGGAASAYTHFYYPPHTFRTIGRSTDSVGFLGIMEVLESVCEGMYIAAVREFLRLDHPDLAAVAAQVMGVESEHRTLGRIIGKVNPPNDYTLVRAPYTCIGGTDAVLRPFLTGVNYYTALHSVPTAAQTARVVGKYGTRRVRTFL